MSDMNVMRGLSRPETEFKVALPDNETMRFRIIHWSPTKTFKRIPLVGKYFAVPVSMIMSTPKDSQDFSEVLPAALVQLFNTMEEGDLVEFIKTLLEDVIYEGQPVVNNFDAVFMGKTDVVLQLLAKVIEINYGPFFKTGFASLMTSILPVVKLDQTV